MLVIKREESFGSGMVAEFNSVWAVGEEVRSDYFVVHCEYPRIKGESEDGAKKRILIAMRNEAAQLFARAEQLVALSAQVETAPIR